MELCCFLKELTIDRVFDLTLYSYSNGFSHLAAAYDPDTGFPVFPFCRHV
jgi:hypothetical protein